MSTTFFIVPYDPALFEDVDPAKYPTCDLRLDPHEYSELLLARWPDATVHAKRDSVAAAWTLPPETPQFSGMDITLQVSLQVVAFGTGPERSFIDFILWHRSVIPANYDLYLCHSSDWYKGFLLKPDITEEDIVDYAGFEC